jgi:hypothetical protein
MGVKIDFFSVSFVPYPNEADYLNTEGTKVAQRTQSLNTQLIFNPQSLILKSPNIFNLSNLYNIYNPYNNQYENSSIWSRWPHWQPHC